MLHKLSPVMLSVHKTTGDQFVQQQVFKPLHLRPFTMLKVTPSKVVTLLLLLLLLLSLLPMLAPVTP